MLVRHAALLLLLCAVISAPSSPGALRGVDPEDPAYELGEAGQFACLDGGGGALDRSSLNDGYCDCRDGSDEPGTGACQGDGGKFFCQNEGFASERLFASRVNDGTCDCCDGSDEYASGARSEDTCGEKAAAWNAYADEWTAVVHAGIAAKAVYIEQASESFGALKQQLREISGKLKKETACLEAEGEADGAGAEGSGAPETGEEAEEEAEEEEGAAGDDEEEEAEECVVDLHKVAALKEKQKELRGHVKVFGHDFEWYILAQRCVEFNETRDGQYIYAVCPFVRTPALPRSAFAQACSRAGWDQRDASAAARQLTLDGCGRRTR